MPDSQFTRDTNSPQRTIGRAGPGPTFKLPHDLNTNYCSHIKFVKSVRETPASTPNEEYTGTISLPLPTNMPEAYSIGYNNPALGNIINEIKEIFIKGGGIESIANVAREASGVLTGGGVERFLEELQKAGSNLSGAVSGRFSNAIAGRNALDIARAFQAFTPKSFGDTAIGSAVAQQLGSIPNPHMTTVFAGLGPRTGELRWKLSPRSKHESRQLNDMIKFIRRRIHPEVTANGLSLLFPDEVYIDFFPSEYLIPYKKAVITNLVVNNTPSGRPVFYEGGAPVEIDIVMTVQEVTPRTREDF